jgi:hypothetical protein
MIRNLKFTDPDPDPEGQINFGSTRPGSGSTTLGLQT